MKRVEKRLLSWLMVMAMVLSVIHIYTPLMVHAKEDLHGITLGVPHWNSERITYSFPDVTVNMTDGVDKQKVFCISVSDNGYFEVDLSGIYDSLDISGVRDNGKYADNSGADPDKIAQLSKNLKEKLISVTVLGDITDEEIKTFIKSLTFYRNGADLDVKQKVSVVSSAYDVRKDGGTALAIDGKLHIYKYIDWEENQKQSYKGTTEPIDISASEVAGDSTLWTWFKAYELAKKEKINGLKGYLATITSDEEQLFIYNKFGALSSTEKKNGAWIGGARTFAATSTDSSEKSVYATDVIFDADTMPSLYPTESGCVEYYNNFYNLGDKAKVWRWMCGPESQTEATRKFYTLDNTDAYKYEGTTHTYAKWNRPTYSEKALEPNNAASNKYQQEFCLQYGYVADGAWNDWGPEHSPKSKENSEATKSQEFSSDSAPGGFIVEFSPYDINKNGKDDDGEVPTIPAKEDYTIITAEPHIVSAELDKETFKVNEPISVTSVIGDYIINDGVPSDELITDNKVPAYQWEYFDEGTNTWKNATGEGNNTKTYTPVLEDIGKKLRVHITPKADLSDNPHKYVGDVYLDAAGSDDHSDKIEGTIVGYDEATVTGNDFMIDKDDLPAVTSDKIIDDYSKAEAKVEGLPVSVKPVADGEISELKNKKSGESADITLVNSVAETVNDKVKATVFDNATQPAIDKQGKTSQIGSNDFTVLKGSDPLDKDDVVLYGKVTVLTDGKEAEGNYTITDEDLNKLNDAIKNGPDNTIVPVKVKDETTGLDTTVNVTIKAPAKIELESATLTPYRDKDEKGNLKHYYAGDTITVDKVKLAGIDVPVTEKQLSEDFEYQWQYWSGNGTKEWKDIQGATGITLSAENTTNYAKNKVQVVITPKGDKYDTTNVKKLYADGSSSSKENGDGSDNTTDGTYIDIFTIDANDFVISLKDAKEIDDAKAAKAAGVETEFSNYSSGGSKKVETTPTSDVKDDNGLSKVKKAADVPVKFNTDTSVEGKTIKATDKDSVGAFGKTVTAYVKDSAKTETLEDGTKLGIGANDIEITVSKAAEILKDGSVATQAKLLSADAKVVVVNGDTSLQADKLSYNGGNDSVSIAYDAGNTFKAEKGTYPVTYTYTNTEGKTVSATANVKVISNADIKATDFIISVEDANKAEEDDIEKRANASGKDDNGSEIANDKLDVKDTDMSKLKAVATPGDLPVVISNISATPNPEVSVTAHVVDKTGTDETGKITIGANNFDIYPEDVKKALNGDIDILKSFADVIAIDKGTEVDHKLIKVTDQYKIDLKTEPGKYPVTFTYTNAEDKTVTTTVIATVKVPSVDAHDFIISTGDAKNATIDTIRDRSGAAGVDGDSVPVAKEKLVIDDDSIVSIKDAGDKGISKDIPVKVTNTYKEPYPFKTVTAHVVDETKDNKDKEKDPDKQITIGANNFFISPADADKAKGASGNDDILKRLSAVLAIEGYKDVAFDDIKVTKKDTLDSKPGDYPITFAYKGVDVTVTATVKAPDVSNANIDAHDIIISVGDVKKVTEDDIKEDSGVNGKDAVGNPLKFKDVDVNGDDMDKINNTTTPDMIPVELKNTTAEPKPTKKINAYIVDEQKDNKDTQPDPAKQVSIGANNFDISVEDAQKSIDGDDPILRRLSAVVALDGGKNVNTSDIAVSDKSKLKAEPGKYPVTFSYTNTAGEMVKVTVDATVKASSGTKDANNKDDNNKDNGDGEEITGNDFTVEAGGDPLEPKDIINKGNVSAVDGNGKPVVLPPDSSVNKDDLDKLNDAIKNGDKGTYPVTVTTPDGTKVIVNVTVTDNNDDKKDDDVKTDETIAANNFTIGINDYDKVFNSDDKDDNVKKLSNALAYDTDLKTPVEITKIDTSAVTNEPGTYPVTLATDKGTRTVIMVTVDKDWDTIGDIDKASDSNKSGATTDNETAKKVDQLGTQDETSQPVEQLTTQKSSVGLSGDVKPEDIVYEKTNPQDKTEPIDPAKKIATSGALKVNGNPVPDDMYSVSTDGKKLIISRDYLATLAKGTYPAVLTYADGTIQEFSISILDYDETTLVKNPPLFSMYKEIVLKKKNTFTVNLKGISDYAVVSSEITGKGKKAKKVVSIKQQKNGDVLITPKKTGKTQVTCKIIQNGAEYKVVVDIKVLKQYKGTSKNFNLNKKGLVKTSGELPEFNVYKRIVRGKNTKIKFTKVATDAKVKFYVANKKEAKSLKIGKIKRKGKTATCTIVGKKKGWVHLTAEITQNGKTYYTRLLVRIDDGTWSNKQIKKYLK